MTKKQYLAALKELEWSTCSLARTSAMLAAQRIHANLYSAIAALIVCAMMLIATVALNSIGVLCALSFWLMFGGLLILLGVAICTFKSTYLDGDDEQS